MPATCIDVQRPRQDNPAPASPQCAREHDVLHEPNIGKPSDTIIRITAHEDSLITVWSGEDSRSEKVAEFE